MSAARTPRGVRLHIGIFGRRNAGKSSVLNALVRQDVSIVSSIAGTTTDPVEKPMELLPIGPVQFIDTAGVDDDGSLGPQRVDKTRKVIDRTDLALLVCTPGGWGSFETDLLHEFRARKIPSVVVCNKSDLGTMPEPPELAAAGAAAPFVCVSSVNGDGFEALRQAMIRVLPADFLCDPVIASDLVPPGGTAVLVIPVDKEAPRGRIILPQVQTIRDLLDARACILVVQETELTRALDNLREPPAIVITDSQAFERVHADTPPDIPMTSFSILFARYKGDLNTFVRGAQTIAELRPGDRVLIAESCTHHPIGDDIGRVKIPAWLERFVGGPLQTEVFAGHDFPGDLAGFRLVIHCGACMTNRREMLSRIETCRAHGVPITNYGVAISFLLGICERALRPFPEAFELFVAAGQRGRSPTPASESAAGR